MATKSRKIAYSSVAKVTAMIMVSVISGIFLMFSGKLMKLSDTLGDLSSTMSTVEETSYFESEGLRNELSPVFAGLRTVALELKNEEYIMEYVLR